MDCSAATLQIQKRFLIVVHYVNSIIEEI